MISGATAVAGVIGDPVRHSLSPILHNTAYTALGIDLVYVAFPVPDGATAAALEAARALQLVGLSVTMPHKTAAAAGCDELTPEAAALESVNTVTRRADGTLSGASTDGAGFLASVREAGHDLAGRAVLLLGAGGAARAVAHALGHAGAHVTVAARRADAADRAARLGRGSTVAWDDRVEAAVRSDVVVNATPVGMSNAALVLPEAGLRPGQVVVDLVYHPLDTPLLCAARERGAATVDGLGMLVHQAGLQVRAWTGRDAPTDAMRAAAEAALAD